MSAPHPTAASAPPCLHEPAKDDAAWFKEQIQPHEGALRQYLQRQVPSHSDVDDVMQESFIKVLRARANGQIQSTKAFLFVVARNTALKLFRKRKFISPVPVGELAEWRVLDGGQDVIATVNSRLQDDLIAEAAAELPGRCRDIFLLRVADGLSYSEISRKLGVTESTVRTQMARAMDKCIVILRAKGVTPDK